MEEAQDEVLDEELSHEIQPNELNEPAHQEALLQGGGEAPFFDVASDDDIDAAEKDLEITDHDSTDGEST
jgi:hypothetical protein